MSGRKCGEKRGIEQLSDHTAVREAALSTAPNPAPQRWAAGWGWGGGAGSRAGTGVGDRTLVVLESMLKT